MQILTPRGEQPGREERVPPCAAAAAAGSSSPSPSAAGSWPASPPKRPVQAAAGKSTGQRELSRERLAAPAAYSSKQGERNTSANMQSQGRGSEPGRAPTGRKQKRPGGHEEEEEERSRKTQASGVRGLLREFLEQQLRLDVQRQEMLERQARERLFFEEQWRQSMHRMEQERLVLEQEWVEREEQRRAREEARAERRDAILTSLLTRLLQGDL